MDAMQRNVSVVVREKFERKENECSVRIEL